MWRKATYFPLHRSKRSSPRWIDGSFEMSGGRGGSRTPTGMCSGQRIRYPGRTSHASTMPSKARISALHTLQRPGLRFRLTATLSISATLRAR
jgi:hypothetical protein